MVNKMLILLLFVVSFGSIASIHLNNSDVYTVPKNKEWQISKYNRNDCSVCTYDVYVKSGQVKINGVWVEGTFNFSLNKNSKIIFSGRTIFFLGDVMKSMDLQENEEN